MNVASNIISFYKLKYDIIQLMIDNTLIAVHRSSDSQEETITTATAEELPSYFVLQDSQATCYINDNASTPYGEFIFTYISEKVC